MKRLLILATIGFLAALPMLLNTTWAGLLFDHATHAEMELECGDCHPVLVVDPNWQASMPDREGCLDCHDDEDLPPMPPYPSSHRDDYRWQHQFAARAESWDDCILCHRNSEGCTMCHHGENVDFLTHDRNWRFHHPITYYKDLNNCYTCHDPRTYCQDCHQAHNAQPVNHYFSNWTSPQYHGAEARVDLTTCLQCHNGPDPVCRTCHGEP